MTIADEGSRAVRILLCAIKQHLFRDAEIPLVIAVSRAASAVD